MMKASSCALALALALLVPSAPASADEGIPSEARARFDTASLVAGSDALPPMRLVGRVGSPGRLGGHPSGGVFLGVDTGVSLALAAGTDPAQHAWAFGGRGGYEFRNGLALQIRYDYLGLAPHLTDPPTGAMQIGSAGLRYSIPFLVPMPFFEAMWGPAVEGDALSIAGGLGLGGSVPLGRHVRIDLAVRDWLTPLDDHLHQILLFELGGAVSFGGPRH